MIVARLGEAEMVGRVDESGQWSTRGDYSLEMCCRDTRYVEERRARKLVQHFGNGGRFVFAKWWSDQD